ncbi:hypothetical protein I3842_01G252100 [Carya illinoinensis]|uniref:Uncharacterized protein n=1 Tax=Carya illinoinensis TaxID=32201 RepID=A0A922K8C5_CARIL|nr:hypothetical protein I3842_01G252100 [Carya illinoinensis]
MSTSLELQIHSSLMELSRFKNFITTSVRNHTANDGYWSSNEILRDFIGKFDKLCLEADAITGKQKQPDQCSLEVNSSRGIKLSAGPMDSAPNKILKPLGCSGNKVCISSCKGKAVMQTGMVEQLNERLEILEEETETMKKDLFGVLEERRTLVNEIYEQFQIIQHCLCLRNQAIGETCPRDHTLIAEHALHMIRCDM